LKTDLCISFTGNAGPESIEKNQLDWVILQFIF
jgi:nicotinamide mononucleotide (NMN) deamidase PncC